MDWRPITSAELADRLDEELEAMPIDMREQYKSVAVSVYPISCDRGGVMGEEQIYVVGQIGDLLLVFDDVEDEFGIAQYPCSDSNPLTCWELVGTLEQTLKKLWLNAR